MQKIRLTKLLLTRRRTRFAETNIPRKPIRTRAGGLRAAGSHEGYGAVRPADGDQARLGRSIGAEQCVVQVDRACPRSYE